MTQPDSIPREWMQSCARAICRQAEYDAGHGPSKTLDNSIEQGMWRNYINQARVAFEVLRPLIEAETRERCAVIADIIALSHEATAATFSAGPCRDLRETEDNAQIVKRQLAKASAAKACASALRAEGSPTLPREDEG